VRSVALAAVHLLTRHLHESVHIVGERDGTYQSQTGLLTLLGAVLPGDPQNFGPLKSEYLENGKSHSYILYFCNKLVTVMVLNFTR